MYLPVVVDLTVVNVVNSDVGLNELIIDIDVLEVLVSSKFLLVKINDASDVTKSLFRHEYILHSLLRVFIYDMVHVGSFVHTVRHLSLDLSTKALIWHSFDELKA